MTGPIVIKIGGTTLEDPKTSPQLWDAIAALAAARNGKGGIIVVHGGGKAVDRFLERLGFSVERKHGLRVTSPEQIDAITGVLSGSINKSIVAQLRKRRIHGAVGLCVGDGEAVPVRRKVVEGVDLGLVGEVDPGEYCREGGLYHILCQRGFVPVVSSIGIDETGCLLNLNADDAAFGVARNSSASALLLMTDVPGILDERGQLIPSIDTSGIEHLITKGVITGGMIPKARAAAFAAEQLGAPVVIMSGSDPSLLTSWSAGRSVGTTVSAPIR